MAIGTPVERKQITTAGMASTPYVISPATTIQAGTLAVLIFTSGASKSVTAVSDDTGGNTWTIDHVATDTARVISIASCQVATQITSSNNISLSMSNLTSNTSDTWIYEVSGLATSSAFDKSHDGSGSGTAVSSGATATLANASEIAFGVFRTSAASATWTKNASFTNGTTTPTTTTSALEYEIVSSTSAVTATGTFGTTGSWVGTVVTYQAGAAGPAPSNTVAPAVTGTTTVGSVLTTDNGTWTDDGSPTFTYQWQRDVAGNGTFSNISSATSSTYTLVEADDGNKVRCQVKDTDSNGNTTANSNAVGLITEAAVPTISVAPVVSGTTTVGQALSTTNGTWTAMGGSVATFAYQWQRDNTGGGVYGNIAAATSSSYTLVDADDACNIKCLVTATNDVGASSPAASNTVGTVIEPAPTNSAVPTLGGVNAKTNNTITSTTGTWTHMGGSNPTFTYQWQDSADGSTGWANVTGATSSSYKVAVGELNKFLRCVVTAHNTNASTASANTVASAQVTAGVAVASGVRFSPVPFHFYLQN